MQSTQEQLRQLVQSANQALTMLRAQQESLRALGMNLPSGTLDRLSSLEMTLDALSMQFVGVHSELRQLRALAQTTALINSTLDLNEVLRQVMDTVISLTGAERGFVMLKNESGELEVRVAQDIDLEALDTSDFLVSSTIINEVVQSGQAVLTDNAGNDPRYQDQKSILRGAFRSILAVPLRVRDAVTGVVYCDNRILAGVFKEHDLNLLRAFAEQAAVALHNARLFEAARRQVAEIARIRDLMANVFASIASGLVTLDLEARITSFNAAAERITARQAADIIGSDLWQALPNPSEAFIERLRRVQTTQTREQLETQIEIPGLGLRDWRITITPLRDADGVMRGTAIVLDDLTETRQREAQLREVRRYLPLALVENIHSADLTGLGGQEREISVVFADVRGFTSFSEASEPELVMQIINRYLTAASSAINLYEGVIDKYLGDAITGLFNTQLNPQDDHAGRAVRSALRIIKEVLVLHERLPEAHRLAYGIGIHTGTAILGNVGSSERREFTAVGEAVDVSQYLQEYALPGDILLSEATYALVRDDFECEVFSPSAPAQASIPGSIYRLIGRKRRTGQAPMVQPD
jgi:PAS domain S-box-containing protein